MRLYFLVSIFISTALTAQVSKVSLQASGLTCSMCSNSIYKSLKTISFVDKVEPNIKTSTFEITFKQGSHIDFNKLRDKVEDAGYAVSKFVATVDCNNVQLKANEPTQIGNVKFKFVNVREQSLDGVKQVKIVNKGFVPLKEFKKIASGIIQSPDVYFATI